MVIERKETSKKKKELEEKEKINWKLYNDVILPRKFEEQSKLHLIESSINDFVNNLKNTDEISLFFSKNEKTLRFLFEFLVNTSFTPLNFVGRRLTLNLEGLSNFAVKYSNNNNILINFFFFQKLKLNFPI